MKIYLIDTSVHTPKGRSLGIWSFHDYMYNGVTARVRRPISLYGDNREPLNVIKNIYNFADLIWVDYNVVVKEELVDIIKPKFNNIDFLKVEFSSFLIIHLQLVMIHTKTLYLLMRKNLLNV